MTEEQNMPEKNTEAESGKLKAEAEIENVSFSEQPKTETMEVHHPGHVHKKRNEKNTFR